MTSSTTLWYASQATGVVCLVLFSAVIVLGVLVHLRTRLPGLPRFGTVGLHRSLTLLSLVFLGLHIGTAVADSYVDISLLDSVVPFVSDFQPLWLGLGTVAFDLMLAVAVTSMLRARMGRRIWKGVHWLAYASWPVAVVHAYTLGAGSGTTMGAGWALWLTVGCVLAVLAAVAVRLLYRERTPTPADLLAAGPGTGADVAPIVPIAPTAPLAGAGAGAGNRHRRSA